MSEPKIKPKAWMALHAGKPVQVTVSEAQAEAWVRAGGTVVDMYDGPTLLALCDHAADTAWAYWQSDADPIDQGRALAADELAQKIRAAAKYAHEKPGA